MTGVCDIEYFLPFFQAEALTGNFSSGLLRRKSRVIPWRNFAIPSKVKSRPQCCDDDAMIICGCMARLKKNNRELHDLLVDYYVGGMTFMALARKHGRSDCWVGRLLQKAEGIVDGMLITLEIELEMDR